MTNYISSQMYIVKNIISLNSSRGARGSIDTGGE